MSARNDRRTFAEDIAVEVERAASRVDSKTVYMLSKNLSSAQTNPCLFIEDKSGHLLTNQADIQNRWSEYFSDVLNQPIPHEPLLVPDVPPFTLNIYSGPILFQEVVVALKSLKKWESSRM